MASLVAIVGWLAALALLARARAREELVARACHELRSPLTAARLALEAGRAPATVELQPRPAGRAAAAPRGPGARRPGRGAPRPPGSRARRAGRGRRAARRRAGLLGSDR